MAMKRVPYFDAATLRFLRSLARHNDRAWFNAHKAAYETHVRGPALSLIADLGPPLARISPSLVADPRPVGGSLFRIQRDTRFSKDKIPYKTHAGMTFFHAASRQIARGGDGGRGRLDAPVLYLHVEPGGSFVGGGLWHPEPKTLKRVRDFMIDNPQSFKNATRRRPFAAEFALTGETLSRPPKGYAPGHELIDDLKRRDLVATSALSDEQIVSPALYSLLIARFKLLAPLLEWLCLSLDLEF